MFNHQTRNQLIRKLETQSWDLIIIGGGITGAGILLDASTRGLKCLLIEMNDFSSGTSSKSTKLIHGGLRYLKQAQIAVVRDSVKERAILHKNAPNLIQPQKMLLPIMSDNGFNRLELWAGLSLYDFLGGVPSSEKKKMLGREKARQQEPLLDRNHTRAAGLYTEYRTDDARLVIELIKRARTFGAEAINYCKVQRFQHAAHPQDKKRGQQSVECIDLLDKLSGNTYKVKARKYINATGAWCDDLARKDNEHHRSKLVVSKGCHIVIPKDKLSLSQSVYFPTNDKRMIFAIPRLDSVYIGTTDIFYKGDKDQLHITKDEVDYLISQVNFCFPYSQIKTTDIISHWVGVRPLIKPDGNYKNASELSRKDEVFISRSGVIHITGGKLTGYRKMAKKVVDLLSKKKCQTKNLAITQTKSIDVISHKNLDESHSLYFKYGAIYQEILKLDSDPYIAELKYCLEHEMIMKPLDFIERRSGNLFFNPDLVRNKLQVTIEFMARYLSWDDAQSNKMYEESLKALECLSLRF